MDSSSSSFVSNAVNDNDNDVVDTVPHSLLEAAVGRSHSSLEPILISVSSSSSSSSSTPKRLLNSLLMDHASQTLLRKQQQRQPQQGGGTDKESPPPPLRQSRILWIRPIPLQHDDDKDNNNNKDKDKEDEILPVIHGSLGLCLHDNHHDNNNTMHNHDTTTVAHCVDVHHVSSYRDVLMHLLSLSTTTKKSNQNEEDDSYNKYNKYYCGIVIQDMDRIVTPLANANANDDDHSTTTTTTTTTMIYDRLRHFVALVMDTLAHWEQEQQEQEQQSVGPTSRRRCCRIALVGTLSSSPTTTTTTTSTSSTSSVSSVVWATHLSREFQMTHVTIQQQETLDSRDSGDGSPGWGWAWWSSPFRGKKRPDTESRSILRDNQNHHHNHHHNDKNPPANHAESDNDNDNNDPTEWIPHGMWSLTTSQTTMATMTTTKDPLSRVHCVLGPKPPRSPPKDPVSTTRHHQQQYDDEEEGLALYWRMLPSSANY